MKTKGRECEDRAKKVRDPQDQEWQFVLARAYRMLAEAEGELAKQPLKLVA